ncbi:hypothetical protein LOAG_04788 [Loa loa]|uniref:Uncharacterized protein n=1 Tax=Loa loa TaxID=7209 RepID=A0A1S0U1W8_LOALO|nr:hypothetical protein LOAG_04788 [Loa loa]EFO23693.1 hypothetical protein LOAG_04788 [Loa loa]
MTYNSRQGQVAVQKDDYSVRRFCFIAFHLSIPDGNKVRQQSADGKQARRVLLVSCLLSFSATSDVWLAHTLLPVIIDTIVTIKTSSLESDGLQTGSSSPSLPSE